MSMDLTGKNIVYTGGLGGIGYATCKVLLNKNIANLYILDKYENPVRFEQLKAVNEQANVYFYVFDITNELDKIIELFQRFTVQVQRIDILINGVGIFNDLSIDVSIRTNLIGLINTSTAAFELWSKHLHSNGTGGLIVNIASVVGLDPFPAIPVYSAAKAGVVAYTKSIAQLQNETGIAAICICPGLTRTLMLDHMPTYLNVDLSLTAKVNKLPVQSADECGMNIVTAIEQYRNGILWLLDQGKIELIKPSVVWQAPTELVNIK